MPIMTFRLSAGGIYAQTENDSYLQNVNRQLIKCDVSVKSPHWRGAMRAGMGFASFRAGQAIKEAEFSVLLPPICGAFCRPLAANPASSPRQKRVLGVAPPPPPQPLGEELLAVQGFYLKAKEKPPAQQPPYRHCIHMVDPAQYRHHSLSSVSNAGEQLVLWLEACLPSGRLRCRMRFPSAFAAWRFRAPYRDRNLN